MDSNELKIVMLKYGDNMASLADYLGITRSWLSRKINETGSAKFTYPEIKAIKKRYKLTQTALDHIFFAN